MKFVPIVMLSSTVRDLPDHRAQVMDACLRQGMFPLMMEHLPATDKDAMRVSVEMVAKADIFVGVYAHRYGHVPQGSNQSLVEIEYECAELRDIPRLIFVIDKRHPIMYDDIDIHHATQVAAFRERLCTNNVVNFFTSAEHLRSCVINSLSHHRQSNVADLHYISEIPLPPLPYVAHPYTLLQNKNLIGRSDEMNWLNNWARMSGSPNAGTLTLVAMGGMGKSALTWKWFNDVAPHVLKPLAGRMWWSFYESDAQFDNFVVRALAYVSRQPRRVIEEMSPAEREAKLLVALEREPFLIVLDGLERILNAYVHPVANKGDGQDWDDEETSAVLAGAAPMPDARDSLNVSLNPLRRTVDPRAGIFLSRLASLKASRVLITTRLRPAGTTSVGLKEYPGMGIAYELPPLQDQDALDLWRSFGVGGSDEALLQLFARFGNYPLLICALAGEVAHYRYSPGDYDHWRRAHPDFQPFKDLPIRQIKTHVLQFALRGLNVATRNVLHTIAAFRMPATYDTLVALLVGEKCLFITEDRLDRTLCDLEDRGLLGWDRRANRYDLHPVVRGITWANVDEKSKRTIYERLRNHFGHLPAPADSEIRSISDTTSSIELFNALVGLGEYNDACDLLKERGLDAILHRLAANGVRLQLLEALFPATGIDADPLVDELERKVFVLNDLALAYVPRGRTAKAVQLFERQIALARAAKNGSVEREGLNNISNALRLCGRLKESERSARRAILISRETSDQLWEAINLHWWGLTLAARGDMLSARTGLNRAIRLLLEVHEPVKAELMRTYLAQIALWEGNAEQALSVAREVENIAQKERIQRHYFRAVRIQGEATLCLGDLDRAEKMLSIALEHAKAVDFLEEALPAEIALAKIRVKRGDFRGARAILEEVQIIAGSSPYRLSHTDALNVLAELEIDSDAGAAFVVASKAYQLAWCDGPPFAYHRGINRARELLMELQKEEPFVPGPNNVQFEMPEVEIDPHP
jgi:tetratricopeptide (TPR) repeat protein